MNTKRRTTAVATLLVALAAASSAQAATSLLHTTAAGTAAKLRTCHARVLDHSASVRSWTVRATDTGLVRAELSGGRSGSDWDLAVFGAGERFVAGAAGPDQQ